MARLFSTAGAVLDTIDEGSKYMVDRISVLRYDSLYENFQQWYTEKRSQFSIPPHLREDYVAFVKSKKNQE